MDFRFEAPLDEVAEPLVVRIEHQDGATDPPLAQCNAFFGKRHGQPVNAQLVQFDGYGVSSPIGQGLHHPHDGFVEAVPEPLDVVGEAAEVEVEDGGVGVDF